MWRALWNGAVIAEAECCQTVEGNLYFPPDSLVRKYFIESSTRTSCQWKGTAHYYHVVVSGIENRDGAWYYPQTQWKADHIKGWIAFWQGIEIQGENWKC